ncbi:DUF5702 domain-containing protein [Alkaliphilus transvaalensis]|uniref:DUF5702 domain-containing protein n=1 Tax=Alkaliphilus transvaalensis TaxID=114628 RepID=UPI00047B14CF|nr:DUF5702 domain-containing protein [Alkaliphilus transvaalensis]
MFSLNRGDRKLRNLEGERGAITIFLSITLLLVITLTGMLVDGARIRTSETILKRTTANALHSTLSHYDQTLKDDYGLFAMAIPGEELFNYMKLYLDKGLEGTDLQDLEEFWNIYQFQIEGITTSQLLSLGEDEVIQQQILDFMKYRGPKAVVEEVMSLFKDFSKVGEASKLLDEKTRIEKELAVIAHFEGKLDESIQKASSFNLSLFKQVNSGIKNSLNQLISEQDMKLDLERQYQRLATLLSSKQTEEERSALLGELEGTRLAIQSIETTIGQLSEGIHLEIENQIELIEELLLNNRNIKNLSIEIEGKSKTLKIQMEALLAKETQQDNSLTQGMLEDLKKYHRAMENYSVKGFDEKSEANIVVLTKARGLMGEIKSIIQSNIMAGLNNHRNGIDEIFDIAEENLSNYDRTFSYNKWKLEEEVTGVSLEKDTRRETAKQANELLKEDATEKKVIPLHLQELLPSKGTGGDQSEAVVDFHEVDQDVNYNEKSHHMMDSIAKGISQLGIALRDELYINEYILGTFKSHVTPKEEFQLNLRNDTKASKISFFDNEIEYILYGNPSQTHNFNAARRDLLMLRFVVNLVYVFNNPQLVKEATILATALAAPIGGAAMPFIKAMILSGWAMGYSIEDVKNLLAGERVDFYRNKHNISLNYEDYLRLFLLKPSLNTDLKLDRIKDLIQLNLQQNPLYGEDYLIQGSNTFINVKVDYSIKVFFMNQLNNRSFYQLELWQGY